MKPQVRIITALAAAAILLLAVGCGDGKKGAATGSTGCRAVGAPKPRAVKLRTPHKRLSRDEKLTAVVKTSCGSFEILLNAQKSPKTGGSFAYLARKRVFDGTTFHRIVPGFVIQGGDPQGDGQGGPGYSVEEAPPQSTAYTRGIVAMAKTGVDPPGTSGSQFFVVIGADAGLPPDYALLGRVTRGMNVVKRIGRQGDPASGGAGTPKRTVLIESVRLRRG